jgi:uncharacterized protein YdhG (YjbR/CyaY superfamily)
MPGPIDDFLAGVEPSKRTHLERVRALAHEIVPDAEETISYGMPTLTYAGKPFLGFAAHAHHVGIYPHSGRVLPALADRLDGYGFSKGALRGPFDRPISEALLRELIGCRLEAIRAETTKRR